MKRNSARRKRASASLKVIRGSGNIFADLGLADADELLAKAKVLHVIGLIIKQEKLTQIQAAKRLGVDQPKISLLLHGKLSGFSLERLLHFLNKLGRRVEISIGAVKEDSGEAGIHVSLSDG